MSPTLDELKATAAALPPADRAELVRHLLHTLDPAEDGAAAAWAALAARRVEDARAGRVAGVPAEQVLESLRRPRP